MEYVNLGRSGLKVSRLCLGCMSFGVPERGVQQITRLTARMNGVAARATVLVYNPSMLPPEKLPSRRCLTS